MIKKGIYIVFTLFIILILACSCVSTGTTGNTTSTDNTSKDTGTKKTDTDTSAMAEYLENGIDKINYGSISEGIEQLILVLAEKSKMKNPSKEAIEIAQDAETRLNKLKSALYLEVEPKWLDSNLNQVKGDAINIAIQPSVILTYDSGIGRSLVSNAPIAFKFTKGSGVITANIVKTNDYGQANITITRFDNPNEENIIEAFLYYKEKDFTYAFPTVSRSFIYAPPERRATIFVLEQYPDGVFKDPDIFNKVYNNLKDVAFDFSLSNAYVKPDDFMKVYNGDTDAIGKLGLEKGVSYICAVLNDCFNVKQYEYQGKKYNIYISEARATIRIIRVADGKAMYSNSVEALHKDGTNGKGNSPEQSARDALKKTSDAMEQLLKAEIGKIKNALTGTDK